MTYKTLREQCLKWDRSQQRWSTLVSGSDNLVPMEVDRIDGKGWNNQYGKKGKGKGKNDKGSSKGKSKGKGKTKTFGKNTKGESSGRPTWVTEATIQGKKQQLCMQFQSGKCNKGDLCKFGHFCAYPLTNGQACGQAHSAFSHQHQPH